MRRLLTYMRPYWVSVTAAGLLLSAAAGLQVIGPLLTKTAVDRYMAPAPGLAASRVDQWLPQDRWSGLAVISAAYLAVLALIGVCDFAQGYLMQRAGQYAMADLRAQLMRRLQQLDIAYFDRNPVGRLVTRVTTDVDALNDLFTSGLISILGDLFTLALIAVAMVRVCPALVAIVLVVTPL